MFLCFHLHHGILKYDITAVKRCGRKCFNSSEALDFDISKKVQHVGEKRKENIANCEILKPSHTPKTC